MNQSSISDFMLFSCFQREVLLMKCSMHKRDLLAMWLMIGNMRAAGILKQTKSHTQVTFGNESFMPGK